MLSANGELCFEIASCIGSIWMKSRSTTGVLCYWRINERFKSIIYLPQCRPHCRPLWLCVLVRCISRQRRWRCCFGPVAFLAILGSHSKYGHSGSIWGLTECRKITRQTSSMVWTCHSRWRELPCQDWYEHRSRWKRIKRPGETRIAWWVRWWFVNFSTTNRSGFWPGKMAQPISRPLFWTAQRLKTLDF